MPTDLIYEMEPSDGAPFLYPQHWKKGQLLNVRQFTDSTFRACLLEDEPDKSAQIHFTSKDQAQDFVSWWYAPEASRV